MTVTSSFPIPEHPKKPAALCTLLQLLMVPWSLLPWTLPRSIPPHPPLIYLTLSFPRAELESSAPPTSPRWELRARSPISAELLARVEPRWGWSGPLRLISDPVDLSAASPPWQGHPQVVGYFRGGARYSRWGKDIAKKAGRRCHHQQHNNSNNHRLNWSGDRLEDSIYHQHAADIKQAKLILLSKLLLAQVGSNPAVLGILMFKWLRHQEKKVQRKGIWKLAALAQLLCPSTGGNRDLKAHVILAVCTWEEWWIWQWSFRNWLIKADSFVTIHYWFVWVGGFFFTLMQQHTGAKRRVLSSK